MQQKIKKYKYIFLVGGFIVFVISCLPSLENNQGEYLRPMIPTFLRILAGISPFFALSNYGFKRNVMSKTYLEFWESLSALSLLLAPFFTIISFIMMLYNINNEYHPTDAFYAQYILLIIMSGFCFYLIFIKKDNFQSKDNSSSLEDIL